MGIMNNIIFQQKDRLELLFEEIEKNINTKIDNGFKNKANRIDLHSSLNDIINYFNTINIDSKEKWKEPLETYFKRLKEEHIEYNSDNIYEYLSKYNKINI